MQAVPTHKKHFKTQQRHTHTNCMSNNKYALLQQGLTFAWVLRWRLWPCCPPCHQAEAEDSVFSLGRAGGSGIGPLLRRGLRKRRRRKRRRRRRRRRWGQAGSWAPDSCPRCCCSHWHSLCYPRGQNRCCRPSLPHPHPVAHRGSCSCQPCAVLVQPRGKTHTHLLKV